MLTEADDTKQIDVIVPEKSGSFFVQITRSDIDRISISVRSPTGEMIDRIPVRWETIFEVHLEESKTMVKIEYYSTITGSTTMVTRVGLIDPIPGTWTIFLHGDLITNGKYDAWLPITGLAPEGVKFVNSDPNNTIVVPATGAGVITCGAYNSVNEILYEDSSWGPSRSHVNSPDLVAPGVNVQGMYPNNTKEKMTGTSVSAGILTGACALMLEWGIVERNNLELNTTTIRAFLIRGCTRDPEIKYPSEQWGYGELNLYNTFSLLRP
jgi:hypothetical protein